jgi:hypothetical protein
MEKELNNSLFIYEIMGLQYFSLKSLNYKNYKHPPTFFRVVLMFFLIAIILLLMITYVVKDHKVVEGNLTAKNVLMFAVHHLMNFGLILVTCTSIIQSYTSDLQVKMIYINFKEILQISQQEFGSVWDFKKVKVSARKRMICMSVFIILLHGTVMLMKIGSSEIIFKMLLGLFPVLFFLMISNKFIFYVTLINYQLKLLITLLTQTFQSIKIIDNINCHLKPKKFNEDSLNKLRTARKVYNLIQENASLTNESNGLTILIMFVGLVVALTVSGFEIFVIIVGGLPIERLSGKMVLYFSRTNLI